MLHSVSNVIKLFFNMDTVSSASHEEDELTNIPANRQVGTCCLPPFISDEDEIWEKIHFVKCLSFWGRSTKLVTVDKLLSHWADFLRITKFTLRVSLSLCLTIKQISLKIFYRHIWSTLLQSVKFNFFCCFPSLHHNLFSPMCSEERQTLVNTNEQKSFSFKKICFYL